VREEIRITLVRHGQSEANLVQRWQGQGDSPLSALGRQQAERLGRRLIGRRFTRAVASDLQRAVDTARATGREFDQDVALREFDVGCWEGLTREEVEARYPEEMERLKQGEDIPLGGGESYGAFSQRIDLAFQRLRAGLEPGDHALIVCHGGVIATLLAGLLGLRASRSWALARVANTSITELSLSQRGALLHVFNDTLHLAGLGSWPAHSDISGSVGLVCETLPEPSCGAFAAHYDAAEQLSALGPAADTEAHAALLATRLSELSARHPGQRVSLAAHGSAIHAWAEQTLFRRARAPRSQAAEAVSEQPGVDQAALALPARGSISHVGRWADRLLLLDYALLAS
jgi:broad specificity phosphatase PhoE